MGREGDVMKCSCAYCTFNERVKHRFQGHAVQLTELKVSSDWPYPQDVEMHPLDFALRMEDLATSEDRSYEYN